MTIADALVFLIQNGPGRTEDELAKAIFGNEGGYQQRVNQECNLLVGSGRIIRCGEGGRGDPYKYIPALGLKVA